MPYLFAAFSVVWIVIFLYTLSISRRQQELSREVEALRRMTMRRRIHPHREGPIYARTGGGCPLFS